MDRFGRDGRLVLSAAVATAVACGGQGLPLVGVSPPRAPDEIAPRVDGGAPERPPVAADFRSHMARLTERFLSRGHGERFDAIVWSSDPAGKTADPQADLTDGAMFVEEAIVRDTRGDRNAGLLVMTKQGDSFRFDAIDPDGHVASRGRVAACATCHRETKGSVFPWLTTADGG